MTATEIFLAAAVLVGVGLAVATHLGLKSKASRIVFGRNHLSAAEFSALFDSPEERKWATAIRDQLRSYIPVDPALVRPDDKLCAELQLAAMDGLDANAFVADVEKLTGVKIPDAEAERMLTLRDVISYVAARERTN
jgi:acyl carrier protein